MSRTQDQIMRDLLIRLELLSHGSTQNISPDRGGGGDKERPLLPPGELKPPHLYWCNRYNAATTDTGRDTVIEGARGELGLDTHSRSLKSSPETQAEEDARICTVGEGFTADEVALNFHCTPRRVTAARKADDRDPTWGKPLQSKAAPVRHDACLIEDVLRLSDAGAGARQIAVVLDKPKSTVHDIIRRHRQGAAA